MAAKKSTGFNPQFAITSAIAGNLMKIEGTKESVLTLPITP